jgi:nucleolar complex protein 2
MIKQYTNSIHRLLENLSDTSTQRLTLTSILPIVPYVVTFRKIVKDLCKIVVDMWSDKSSDEATRIAAFLVMRRLMVVGDAGMREAVLRATYQGLVKGSRNTTTHNIQGINLMKNSGAELWGIDPSVGYQTGFTFIRQLAIHLRTSITTPSKDSYKQVYNWQYVHSLDFWSRVLSQHCNSLKEIEEKKQSPLRPLIYPTVQVTLGAMRLIPTAQYFPLRFQLIRALLRISQATGTFIPIAPALYEVLNSKELKKPPKSSLLKPLDFSTTIRAAKQYLRSRTYQDGLGEEATTLLAEFFVLWTKSIAFPELALPVIVMLKRWYKDVSSRSTGNKNNKVNEQMRLLIQKLEASSRWIEERRAKVEFAPNNRAEVEGFLKSEPWEKTPLGAFVVTMRTIKEEKRMLIEEARREEQRKKKGGDDESSERDEEMFDESDEDEVVEDADEDEMDGEVGGGGEEWTVRAAE